MSMNKDEALRCLQISKDKYKEGNTSAALKFATKSISLCETDEGKDWLGFISKMGSTPNSTASKADRPTEARKRTSSTASASEADSSASRSYTPEQVAGIKRIKACKGKGDLYEILGLTKGCSDAEIKKAYRKLALQFHPDKCGAPGTDDAFKAIGHAFAVLGDSDKRAKYDRFGIDSDNSRGGGGGGGAGGMFGQGFGGPQFESEISPEDLFNMFFGDMGGPGMRMHSFTSGPGFRQPSFRRHSHGQGHRQQQQAPQGQLMQFIHLLPVIILFVFPILSAMFSGLFGDSDPAPTFSFVRSHTHNMERKTAARHVPYYVNTRIWNKWKVPRNRPDEVRRYDSEVESEWHRNLQHLCAQEQDRRQFQIRQAHGWFSVDEKRLRAAQNMPMRNCDKLRAWK
ncbi:hypothetical protein DFJ77DRAFT_293660 [Powellomyces hirtus]|nr:hypothetical protein DFJ77DRAFT_293660 [Powellomyces hirtus]